MTAHRRALRRDESAGSTSRAGPRISRIEPRAYCVPTDFPESDGTFEWKSTTIIVVEVTAGNKTGLGYAYAGGAALKIIADSLNDVLLGAAAMDITGAWQRMVRAVRNQGRAGVCSAAISAVDSALWDLKAKWLNLPLVKLLGQVRPGAPAYGSGGFTSYSTKQLQQQLATWVRDGLQMVKMKIGRDAKADIARVRAARQAIGRNAELFVDANGAYSRKQALAQAERFSEFGVSWFEEPVSSDDLAGLRFVRERAPNKMEIAAGEYGYDVYYFRRMLEAQAVDVIQFDATRCGGITGFMQAAALADAFQVPVSAHTAPSLHLHPVCALSAVRHVEYFHDHARIEHLLFDGATNPVHGLLQPDLSRPGLGLELKRQDAQRYAA